MCQVQTIFPRTETRYINVRHCFIQILVGVGTGYQLEFEAGSELEF